MPRLTLNRIRDLVRSLNYVVSIHGAEELDDDNLTILDLESFEAESIVKLGHTGTLVVTIYIV